MGDVGMLLRGAGGGAEGLRGAVPPRAAPPRRRPPRR